MHYLTGSDPGKPPIARYCPPLSFVSPLKRRGGGVETDFDSTGSALAGLQKLLPAGRGPRRAAAVLPMRW